MKIVCDSCGAKYSIADEKVAGRVFKIRCKKCSAAIVVRGDQLNHESAEEDATRVVDYGGDAVWHVVVNGEQQGPYAPAQIGALLADQTIQWDAFVWKEGFGDWQPAQDVQELVDAVMRGANGGEQAVAAEEPATEAAEPTPDAMQANMGADPFAAAPAAAAPAAAADPAADMFGAAAPAAGAADQGADLFAQQSPEAAAFGGPADSPDDVVASQAGPRVSAEQALTGARNENSVLFSLSNLQALATGGSEAPSATSGAPASSDSGRGQAGMASGEGSGLIDIRALASADAATSGAAPAGGNQVDALMNIGGGGPVANPLVSPVLPPQEEPQSSGGMNPLILGVAVFFGIIVLGGVGIGAWFMTQQDEPQVAQNVPVAAQPVIPAAPASPATPAATPTPAAVEETPTPEATPETPVAAEETAANAEEESAETEAADTPRRSRRRGRRNNSASSAASSESAAAAPRQPSKRRSGRRPSGGESLDSLLDGIDGSGGGGRRSNRRNSNSGGGSNAAASNLPAQPGRTDVIGAMRGVEAGVRRCGNGSHGNLTARVVFRGRDGHATSATVNSGNLPPAVQSCASSAIRRARVPPFSRPTFSVNYPFRI